MNTALRQIPLAKLVPHPGHPNRMSQAHLDKLVRNIERTGRYEPLVVRPCPGRRGSFQIINGHQRCKALRRLGHKTAAAVVWKVNDEQTDLLLASLNRLGGRDILAKKLPLLRRLSRALGVRTLATLLPQTRGQLERLTDSKSPVRPTPRTRDLFAVPVVFFVDKAQEQAIEQALSQATTDLPEGRTRAVRRGTALTRIARCFLERRASASPGDNTTESSVPATKPDHLP
jgi:hypothetical protein